MDALVTAIITTHNRAHLLARAVKSALTQTYRNLEIIVVDDGSRDTTEDMMRELCERHSNLSYIRIPEPRGACHARNQGIAVARGTFVAGLDDDDEWMPERIEKFVKGYDAAFGMLGAFDEEVVGDSTRVWQKKSEISLSEMLYRNEFGNQAFIETQRMRALGGFDESLVAAQDYDMWLRVIASYGPAKILPISLQRIHHELSVKSITRSKKVSSGYFHCYKKHKSKMSKSHRKYQLYRLYQAKRKRLSFLRGMQLMEPFSAREIMRYCVMTSRVKAVIKGLLGKLRRDTAPVQML